MKEISDRVEAILESFEYGKIRYAVRSFLKNLSPQDQEVAGSQLRIVIQKVIDGDE